MFGGATENRELDASTDFLQFGSHHDDVRHSRSIARCAASYTTPTLFEDFSLRLRRGHHQDSRTDTMLRTLRHLRYRPSLLTGLAVAAVSATGALKGLRPGQAAA